MPYTPFTAAELTQMKQFVENGGKLILMDDFGYGNSFLVHMPASRPVSIISPCSTRYLTIKTNISRGSWILMRALPEVASSDRL